MKGGWPGALCAVAFRRSGGLHADSMGFEKKSIFFGLGQGMYNMLNLVEAVEDLISIISIRVFLVELCWGIATCVWVDARFLLQIYVACVTIMTRVRCVAVVSHDWSRLPASLGPCAAAYLTLIEMEVFGRRRTFSDSSLPRFRSTITLGKYITSSSAKFSLETCPPS